MGSAIRLFALLFLHEEENEVKSGDPQKKQRDDGERIKDRIPADERVKQIVRRAVAPHQEHIVVRDRDVGDVGGGAEADYDRERDRHVAPLHAYHPRDRDVEGDEAGDTVRYPRYDVIERQNGIRPVILPRPVRSENSGEEPEDEDKIERRLLQPPL